MKIESVSQKYLKVTSQSMCFILLLSSLLLLYFISDIKSRQNQLSKKDLNTSINTLQRDISERFSVFVSSQIFIDYLRSGQVSRNKFELDINLLVSSLKNEEIEGIYIENTALEVIYSYGPKTRDFVTLKLCYLDNVLNYNFGQCVGQMTLYFSMGKVLQHLTLMNPQIKICSTCKIPFFSDKDRFGSFQVDEQSSSYLNIEQLSSNLKFIYIIAVSAFILAIVVFITLHRSLRRVSQDYIYIPMKQLVSNLESGRTINVENINVQEIKYVAIKLNEYIKSIEEREILKNNARIGELATRVAHDIRSPISILEVLLESNINIQDSEKQMLSLAAKRITDIANDLLRKRPNLNSSIPLVEMLNEVIAEKELEYHSKIELSLLFRNNLSSEAYIRANVSDLKSILSNLINNSIEACSVQNTKCLIHIIVSRKENIANIEISDNGPGIPSEVLKHLLISEFSSGKENGNGVGLYYAQKIIKDMGGKILINSNQGTQVTLNIPCCDILK